MSITRLMQMDAQLTVCRILFANELINSLKSADASRDTNWMIGYEPSERPNII
ncbi:MAG TPA: hypothetical protein VH280_16850 [Verrucomicrobiae bacterium]|jgi:hypothetical protein|nr:hypothetical protein [Verrucomicrobiae bacterium]